VGSRFTEDDFGVTHLVTMFHQDWRLSGSARDVVTSYVAQMSDPCLLVLAEDAHRFAASGTADTVATLWECATGSYHRLCRDSVSGVHWFQGIEHICKRRLARFGVHAKTEVGASVYGSLRGRVAAEID
jgi:hypothetical protein